MSALFGSLSVIALIFGGCCSNVYTLEATFKHEGDSGLIITFSQFVLASILSVPAQLNVPLYAPEPTAKPSVPLRRWFITASMFYAVNMLNNWAFAFQISVPVHIILRSFGSVWTMIAGYLRGKRYSLVQVLSVLLLTAGVLLSAYADAVEKGKNMSAHSESSSSDFTIGLLILLIAQVLAAYMGVYTQDTYSDYETNWQQTLFWSHFLSLPLFLPLSGVLSRQWSKLSHTKPFAAGLSIQHLPTLARYSLLLDLAHLPAGLILLGLNAATQLICISGVNMLSSRSSAVTVTIVLNVRKLVSFMASTLLFGHHMSGSMVMGAALVFGSGALYGWESSWRLPKQRALENGAETKGPAATPRAKRDKEL